MDIKEIYEKIKYDLYCRAYVYGCTKAKGDLDLISDFIEIQIALIPYHYNFKFQKKILYKIMDILEKEKDKICRSIWSKMPSTEAFFKEKIPSLKRKKRERREVDVN